MIEYLSDLDTQILLFFNGIHSPFWDYFMSAFTGKIIWVPMYASILYILFKNFHWKAVICFVVAIALTITFADQMCNSLIRPLVGRLRPSNPENPIADLVYIVNGRHGGGNGFPSCHAANSFGLAVFLICLFRRRWLSIFIVAWAFTNSYTRLYLGLHYPGDLLVGAIIGGFGGWVLYTLAYKLLVHFNIPAKSKAPQQQKLGINRPEGIAYIGLLITIGIIIYAGITSY